MIEFGTYFSKLAVVGKFLLALALILIPIGWIVFKMWYNYRAIIIDRRDTTGRIITSTSAAVRKDKDGGYFTQLWSGGRVDNYPNELIYHTKKDLFKKGLIIVNKIGENSYAPGKLEDMNTIRMVKPKLDADGKPVMGDDGEYVMEEQDVDIMENIIKTYEPTLAFIRREAKRDIERHQSKQWWKENASLVINVVLVAAVCFVFLLGTKYDAQRSGAVNGALKELKEGNQALAKAMIAFRDRDCSLQQVIPDKLIEQRRAEIEAEKAKAAAKDKTDPIDWLKK